ncbi:hypothetical protein [Mesoaciditoga lauensis]|uniref:hypothetical protein n=1 Tax=Mesoaciditoga lauensis TaxID=1495039 RepID=UPI000565C382|nr:hypothetical protein [Mesoaciditoga lauensis]
MRKEILILVTISILFLGAVYSFSFPNFEISIFSKTNSFIYAILQTTNKIISIKGKAIDVWSSILDKINQNGKEAFNETLNPLLAKLSYSKKLEEIKKMIKATKNVNSKKFLNSILNTNAKKEFVCYMSDNYCKILKEWKKYTSNQYVKLAIKVAIDLFVPNALQAVMDLVEFGKSHFYKCSYDTIKRYCMNSIIQRNSFVFAVTQGD